MKNFLNKFDTAFGIPLLPKQIAAMNDSNKILIFQSISRRTRLRAGGKFTRGAYRRPGEISIIFLLLIFAKFNFFYPPPHTVD